MKTHPERHEDLSRPSRWTALVCGASLALFVVAGCDTVPYYEKERLTDPLLVLDDGPTETHFHQKCYYSKEGSAGGIGSVAGGGCGCY